ncbi:PKD domain-containing protein [Synoicihabitans lomoniglobus]|uniref:PKD domain-containing protein n=1 Tax=Synoicihabitans lomoniglobus TaxID=2909285 RepID=A0AAF0CN82_9BACT|nr:PKD domain-containing protein [Opitutaceae bacterium LMO-M01]WED64266.1 PKD domain-containing protein [Opitutaceae bacterium LMO-M01]
MKTLSKRFRPWLTVRRLSRSAAWRPGRPVILAIIHVLCGLAATALEKPETTYPVFQFPRDQIPRIDGETIDWDLVPESYVITRDHMHNTVSRPPAAGDATLAVRVKVGWVAGLNRLYFLYEAEDDYWDFAGPGLRNDTFEIMVDGDASGGPLVGRGREDMWTTEKVGAAASRPEPRISADASHWAVGGVHAQNYHIFTPAVNKDWAMAWGAPTWTKSFPWANAAQSFSFAPGESGKLVLEFWITPFDYAGGEGPTRAVESDLRENKIIGLSWIVIDYDGETPRGFWVLAPQRTSFGQASELCAFQLMPMEPTLLPEIDARWSWQIADMARRVVAFHDESVGEITAWRWDFGDGTTSTERHPIHAYAKTGNYVVALEVTGPAGTARHAKVWDVQFRE